MSIKELLKPSLLKLILFLLIGVVLLYLAKEDVCGAGFIFTFCYKAYGFPFSYTITGDINAASGHIKTLFLGNFFSQYGNFLFNPLTLFLDVILIYSLSCLMSLLFKNMKPKN